MDIFETMDKSISKRFDDMEEYFEKRLDEIYSINLKNDVEHVKFRQMLSVLGANNKKAVKRIEKLEDWRNTMEGNLFAV